MADIVISGNTSGAVTLRAPDVSGTTLLTLPTTSGTIVTTAGATSLTTSGNLTFTGTGNRITGDFINATFANRVYFQTSTAGSNTSVGAIPSASSGVANFAAYSHADPTNSSRIQIAMVAGFDARLISDNIGTGTALPLTMYTGGSERLRIDTSGNVGIGTANPTISAGARLVLQTPSSTASQLAIDNVSFAAGQVIGIDFTVSGGSKQAFTRAIVENGSTAATSLTFGTASGGNNATERMRITSSGNLLVGTTNDDQWFTSTNTGINLQAASSFIAVARAGACFIANRLTSDGTAMEFRRGGTTVGTVSVTGSATAYNTSSDYRLKENVAPMTGALAKVQQLKPCTYTWKSTGEASQGFIAHELQAVVPDCVTGEKDAVDEEGNPVYQGVDTSFLVATLTAAIQELNAKVEAQAAEIAALKGAN